MKQLAVTAVSLVLAAVAALAHIGEAIVSFTDIPPAAWYTQAVGYVQNEGLMLGTGDRKFSPNSTMTRAMLITVLYRHAGSPEPAAASGFNDVVKNSYYEKAVSWAAETGVTAGVGNGKFGVNDPVTREQLATFLWRRAGCPAVDNAVQIFHDADQISEFAFTAIHWAREQRIASGKGNDHFDPKGTATRAEAAEIKPQIIQVEGHPYFQQAELKERVKAYGTRMEHWFPLGHGDANLIQEPVFTELGRKYGKTNVQIILRWHIQEGNIPLPRSVSPEHQKQNLDIFDFSLTDGEMEQIRKLDQGKRYWTLTLDQQEEKFLDIKLAE